MRGRRLNFIFQKLISLTKKRTIDLGGMDIHVKDVKINSIEKLFI